jgi:hypothetical protein
MNLLSNKSSFPFHVLLPCIYCYTRYLLLVNVPPSSIFHLLSYLILSNLLPPFLTVFHFQSCLSAYLLPLEDIPSYIHASFLPSILPSSLSYFLSSILPSYFLLSTLSTLSLSFHPPHITLPHSLSPCSVISLSHPLHSLISFNTKIEMSPFVHHKSSH